MRRSGSRLGRSVDPCFLAEQAERPLTDLESVVYLQARTNYNQFIRFAHSNRQSFFGPLVTSWSPALTSCENSLLTTLNLDAGVANWPSSSCSSVAPSTGQELGVSSSAGELVASAYFYYELPCFFSRVRAARRWTADSVCWSFSDCQLWTGQAFSCSARRSFGHLRTAQRNGCLNFRSSTFE